MAIAGATTEVTVRRSLEQVTNLLVKAGVKNIQIEYGDDGVAEALTFGLETHHGWRAYQMPIRVEGVLATLVRDRVAPRYRTKEHAARVAWRIAHDWLRAQLALIDAQMTSVGEVFFPYQLVGNDPSGRPVRVYEQYLSTQKELSS